MFEMHRKPSAPVALVIDVISWLVALTAFPFVFVDIAVRRVIHWLAIVIVSYIANQLNQHNFTLYYKHSNTVQCINCTRLKGPTWYKYKLNTSHYWRSHLFLSSCTIILAELGGLSESRDITTKRGRASVICREKAGRFPTLQLVWLVYDVQSQTHH